jgi:glycosyltransferase involved in cell wall biosynthesis
VSGSNGMSVTVIVPAYNHALYVGQTLDSLAAQRLPASQLLIVDDASSDDTVAEVERWMAGHPGVPSTLIRRDENGGICSALNEALDFASGDLLMVLASDDWLAEDHLVRCLQVFERHPGTVAVFSDLHLVGADGLPKGRTYFQTLGITQPPEGMIYRQLVSRNTVPAPGVVVRADDVRAVGGYDERFAFEDYPLWLKLSRVGEFRWTGSASVFYRATPGSLSSSDLGRVRQVIAVLDAEIATTEPVYDRLVRRRRAELAKSVYAYARTADERREARRLLRHGILRSPSASMMTYTVTSHVGVPYARLSSLRSTITRLLASRRGEPRR